MIVKICGITTLEDARCAIDAGADRIGLNLVSGPRRIELSTALTILAALPDASRVVALTKLEGVDDPTLNILADHGVRRLQPYGPVTPEAIAALQDRGLETIFVHPVVDEPAFAGLDGFLAACTDARPNYVLFDAAVEGQHGGTGRRANWEAMAHARARGRYAHWPPVILAGGLTPDNVAEAVRLVAPVGVDVSSGVESAPGRKDPRKIGSFLTAVRGQWTE
jgi:phosphoribosylanthranilate isomerase